MRLGALLLGIFTLGSTKQNIFRRVNSQCVELFRSAANRASSEREKQTAPAPSDARVAIIMPKNTFC